MKIILIAFVISILTAELYTAIQTVNETFKMKSIDAEGGDAFGGSVGLSGNYIVVGSYKRSGNTGAVYVFKYDGSNWANGTKYVPNDVSGGDQFGVSVDIQGNRIIVGNWRDGDRGSMSGSAYIYIRNGDVWSQEKKLYASGSGANDIFGQSVAIHGTYAVVSSIFDDIVESDAGSAYLFHNDNTDWRELTTFTAQSDVFADAYFGSSLSINDEYVAIGARAHANTNGAVFLFKKDTNTNTWPREELLPKVSISGGNCGKSVAVYGDRLVFGCPGANASRGLVIVYKRGVSSWDKEDILESSDGSSSGKYGDSVGIWEDLIVVGASGDGVAYCYEYINGHWNESKKLQPSDGQSGSNFGYSLALENRRVVVGSPYKDSMEESGSAYVFDLITSNTKKSVTTLEDSFSFTCSNTRVTGYWEKDSIPGTLLDVSLLDSSCNNYTSNDTHIWISASFDTCGSTFEQKDNFILQGNSAIIKLSFSDDIIYRIENHQYNMNCMFRRSKNISLIEGYNVTNATTYTKTINSTLLADFDVSLDIYTSSNYDTKSTSPLEVAMNEPIYIGVKKMGDNSRTKLIVETCFATPTVSIHGDSYIFFHSKCPLDSSFKIVESTSNEFNFVFNTFRFIKLSGAVYVHCRILVCQSDLNSESCTQNCNGRKRRSVAEKSSNNDPVMDIAYVTSGKIIFVNKISCNDLKCPVNAKCVNTYPAMCRCMSGYVYSFVEHVCKRDRVLKINQLHMDIEWNDAYSDPDSLEFVKLANKTEAELMATFTALGMRDIEGVRVSNARKGSVIFDVLVIYSITTTKTKVFEEIVNHMTTDNQKGKELLQNAGIMADRIVTMEEDVFVPHSYATLVVALCLTILLLSLIIAIIILRSKLKTSESKTTEPGGYDNNGMQMEQIS